MGIYFHEFENAQLSQWMGLICGMCLNYLGLNYLVPKGADQPMLVINMEKKQTNMQRKKVSNWKGKRKQVMNEWDGRDSDVSVHSQSELEAFEVDVRTHSDVGEAIQPSLSDEEAPLLSRSPSPKNLNAQMAKLAVGTSSTTTKWYQELRDKLSLFAVKNGRTE